MSVPCRQCGAKNVKIERQGGFYCAKCARRLWPRLCVGCLVNNRLSTSEYCVECDPDIVRKDRKYRLAKFKCDRCEYTCLVLVATCSRLGPPYCPRHGLMDKVRDSLTPDNNLWRNL